MHIGLLFYSDTLTMTPQTGEVKGRAIANHGFLSALLAHRGDRPTTIFVTSRMEKEFFLEGFPGLFDKTDTQIVTFQEMPAYLKKNRLSVLHVLGPDLYRAMYVRKHIARAPMVVTGVTHSLGNSPFLEWLHLNLLSHPQATDFLVCTTPTAQKAISRMAESLKNTHKAHTLRTEVIPLGIDWESFQKTSRPNKAECGLPEDAVHLLYLGRLSYYSKADLIPLLLVLKKVREKSGQNVRLIIAGATGNENYAEILESVVGEYGLTGAVQFFLNPDDEKKKQLYQLGDMFVAPSDNVQETFGITLVEAMASGLPVIASDWDGYHSLVVNGETGLLIPTMGLSQDEVMGVTSPLQLDSLNHLFHSQTVAVDGEAYAQRITDLVNNPTLRVRLGKQAQEHARHYDWKRVISLYEQAWHESTGRMVNMNWQSLPRVHLNYHEAFSSYATSTLKPEDLVQTTSLGEEVMTGKFPLRIYTAMEEILSVDLMGKILVEAMSLRKVGLISEKLSPEFNEPLTRYHVMWLLKYGYLRTAPDRYFM